MTPAPSELAEQLDRMCKQDAYPVECITKPEHLALLAAALRLAEATGNWFDQGSSHSIEEFNRRVEVMNSALATYRSARAKAAGSAQA